MHILDASYPDINKKMKKIHYVVGKVDQPIDFAEDEKVLFVGNCTSWEGQINGKKVSIKSRYKTCSEVDETKTKSNDLLLTHLKTLFTCFINLKAKYIRVKGCTVCVADHVHYISFLGKTGNPNFDRRMIFTITLAYLKMRVMRALNWLLGR